MTEQPGLWHPSRKAQAQTHPPKSKIRKRDDDRLTDTQKLMQNIGGLVRRLNCLTQDRHIKGLRRIVSKVCIGVALNDRQPFRDAGVDSNLAQFNAARIDRFCPRQILNQLALTAPDIQHPRRRGHHLGNAQQFLAKLNHGRHALAARPRACAAASIKPRKV